LKILYTTDLHFNIEWFEWIKKQEKFYDIFCISGDFLDSSKDISLSKQIDWVSSWIKNFKKPLFICSGNHDIADIENEDWLNKIDNIYSDNAIKTINGIKIGSIPYIAPDFLNFDNCDILIYHLPPAKTKTAIDSKTKKDWGDKELFRMLNNNILSAKILLCGHVHNPINNIDKIKNTTIYNAGCNLSNSTPNHLCINI